MYISQPCSAFLKPPSVDGTGARALSSLLAALIIIIIILLRIELHF